MFASQRKQQILQILAVEKQVMSGELSQRFNVSEDSIRRDLRELAGEGKLQRVHGGALPVSAAIAPIETRKSVQIASKQAVARAAAAVSPGSRHSHRPHHCGRARRAGQRTRFDASRPFPEVSLDVGDDESCHRRR